MTTVIFDPLGVVLHITIRYKFFSIILWSRINWDDPWIGELLIGWNQLISALQGIRILVIPRNYLINAVAMPKSARIAGLCDTSAKAYAALAYLRLEI